MNRQISIYDRLKILRCAIIDCLSLLGYGKFGTVIIPVALDGADIIYAVDPAYSTKPFAEFEEVFRESPI